MRGWVTLGGLLTTVLVLAPMPADAQTAPRRWQVDVFGGISLFELPTSGEAALPPAGPTLPTSGPTNPSRRVPTWFLGDGASLLNGTNAEFGVASRLVPLDAALGAIGLSGSDAPVFGARARRVLTRRWSFEVGAEIHTGAVELDSHLLDTIEQARASFGPAFTGLFTSGPFTGIAVNATAEVTGASSRELALTAAIRFALAQGHFAPYVTLGGGLIHRLGELPQATLAGTYQFRVSTAQGQALFSESDTLTVRYNQSANLVGIAGAGFQQRLTDRLSLAIDGRAYVGRQTLTLRLDSAPVVTTQTPGAFIESFTTPAVQFSNNTATGRASTLSGLPLNGFKAFSTNGLQIRYQVTAGVSLRF